MGSGGGSEGRAENLIFYTFGGYGLGFEGLMIVGFGEWMAEIGCG